MQYLLIILSFLVQASIFVFLGELILIMFRHGDKRPERPAANVKGGSSLTGALLSGELIAAYITGYAAWFTMFEVISLPCVFLGIRTSVLGWICAGLAAGMIAAGLYLGVRNGFFSRVFSKRSVSAAFRSHGVWILIPAAAVFLFCLWQILYSDASVDAMYYLSVSGTAVYTDHLGWFNPTTGEAVRKFTARYIFNSFPFYNAVAASVSGLKSIVQARVIMTALSALCVVLVWYRAGCALFRKQKRMFADMFLLFAMLIIFRGSSQYLQGTFMLKRLYEGKALIAALAVPFVLYIGIEYWNGLGELQAGILFFLCSGMAVCFSGSSIILLAEIPAAGLPVFLRERKFKKCLPVLIGIIPVVCWCLCYILAEKGIIPMRIHR